MTIYSRKELVQLDINITNIKHKLKALENEFPQNYKTNNTYILKTNELSQKLDIQKENDPYKYYKNCPRKNTSILNPSNLKTLKEELYDNLNIEVKKILEKYNYDYINDKSKILTNNPDINCEIVQEIKKRKLSLINGFTI